MKNILNLIGLNSDVIFLQNSIEIWFICFLVIIFTLIIRRFLAKWIINIFFKLINKNDHLKIDFHKRLTYVIKNLIFLAGVFFSFEDVIFPDKLNFEIAEITFSNITNKIFLLILSINIIYFFIRLTDYFGDILKKNAQKTASKLDDQLIPFAIDSMKITIIIIGIFIIIGNIFNINVTALAAGLGVGGIAIAMASKESLENLFGSFTIFLDQPFTVGDIVNVGNITGIVEKVGFRSTRIRTFDQSLVTLPNKKMIDAELDNLGMRPVRRSKFNIGLTYDTSVKQLKNIIKDIQEMIDLHEMTNKEGRVRFMEFGPSSLDIMIVFYVNSSNWDDFINTKEDINYKIIEIIQKHNSSFAFPSRSLYIEKENAPK